MGSASALRCAGALLAQRIRPSAALVVAIAVGWTAPGAKALSPVELDPQGVSLAAYGGWAAWSRHDAATGAFALVARSPQGAVSLPAIAERPAPFDVELGPTHGSGVAAVYSRCIDDAARGGCHLVLLALGQTPAHERALAPPGGGSDYRPAIWRTQIAFLRNGASAAAPDRIFVWPIGSRAATQLALPRSRGNRGAGWPAGRTGRITGLTFNGMQVGFVTSNTVGTFGETTLWFEPLRGRPILIDQQTGGAGNVCEPQFVSPQLSGRWLYAYLHACDPSGNPRLDRLTRYRHGQVQVARYTFIRAGDEAISSVVSDGAGVDWDANGIARVRPVAWRTVAVPVPSTFCGRSDPFC
jgi:hypothetical protein